MVEVIFDVDALAALDRMKKFHQTVNLYCRIITQHFLFSYIVYH